MQKPIGVLASLALVAASALPAQARDYPITYDGDSGMHARAFVRFTLGEAPERARRLTYGLGVYSADSCAGIMRFAREACAESLVSGLELRNGVEPGGFDLWLTGARQTNLSEQARLALGAAEGEGGGAGPWLWIGLGVVATVGVASWALEESEGENCPDGYVSTYLTGCEPIEVQQ
jgi:hypothetical protein